MDDIVILPWKNLLVLKIVDNGPPPFGLHLFELPPIGLTSIGLGLTPNRTNFILTKFLITRILKIIIPSQLLKVGPPPFEIPPIWPNWGLVQMGVDPKILHRFGVHPHLD